MIVDQQAALGFVISQTSMIEQQVYEIRYPDIQYPNIIPTRPINPLWAKTVTYFSMDKFGQANWINGQADDIPRAGTERSKFETAVFTAGIGYGYGMEEIGQAMMRGVNLTADDAMAARRGAEEFIDRVALQGDVEKGLDGFFDHPAIPVQPATTGDWPGVVLAASTVKDLDPILQDINDALAFVHVTATNTVSLADTLLLPWSRLHLLSVTRLGDTNMTLLEFLRRNNVYTALTGQALTIRGARLLDNVATPLSPAPSPVGTRMVVYRRNPEVLVMHMVPHRFLPVWQSGPMRWDVPGFFRLGGVDVRLPNEALYVDGI